MNKLILLIEDDQDIRDSLELLLHMEGYQVRTASNGAEGLLRLRDIPPPDLVLLDLMMPVKNGYEYSAEHRQDPTHGNVPIVVLSADKDVDKKSSQLAAQAILKKPIDMHELLHAVSKHISA